MSLALHATIWGALALLVAAELGKRALAPEASARRWPWLAWTFGAAACAAHVAIAFASRHGWSHAAAVRDTARRTEEVLGVAWGGGVVVNYVFLVLWLAEALWWRADPRGWARRAPAITWLVRGFFLLIVLNAAVVFARPAARVPGALLVAALLWAWRPARAPALGAGARG